jgi:hypothetical protein
MMRHSVVCAALFLLLVASMPARAGMMLTGAGIGQGFTLTTFADGFPNMGGIGPEGIGFNNTGGVIFSSYVFGKDVLFPSDIDNQHYSSALISTSSYINPAGILNVGGRIYQALQGSGQVVQIDNAGNSIQTIQTGMDGATSLVLNPNNLHLFVSAPGAATLWDVDPISKTKTAFLNGVSLDGITINHSGTILYGANVITQTIQGYDTTTKALVFESGVVPGGVDGVALGTGTIAGNIFVNTNERSGTGTIVEVNLTTKAQTTIATGGTRGDLVAVDPSNDTLLLTQTDEVLRLAAPPGGGFAPPRCSRAQQSDATGHCRGHPDRQCPKATKNHN